MANQILHRRDTAANWTAANPVLGAGEIGVESDTNTFKMGDGTTAWASLDYFSGGGGSEIDAVATYTVGAGGDFATVAALSEYFLAQRHATAWEVSGNGRQRAGFITIDLQGLNHSLGGDYISFEWFGSWLVFTNGAIGNGTLVFTNSNVRFANGFAAGYTGNTLSLQANGAFLFDSNDDTNSFSNLNNVYINRGSYLQIWNAYVNPFTSSGAITADAGSVAAIFCDEFSAGSLNAYDKGHLYVSADTSATLNSSSTALRAQKAASIQVAGQPVTAANGRMSIDWGGTVLFSATSGTNTFGNASNFSYVSDGSRLVSNTNLTVSHNLTVRRSSTVQVLGTATVSGAAAVEDSSALIDSSNSVELHPGLPTSDPSVSDALWSSNGVLMLSGGTPPSGLTNESTGTDSVSIETGSADTVDAHVTIGALATAALSSVAVGYDSGNVSSSTSVNIGQEAGTNATATNSISIGNQANYNAGPGIGNVGIGYRAGYGPQAAYNVNVGFQAGYGGAGTYTVAIGYRAGSTSGVIPNNGIVIKSGNESTLLPSAANGILIASPTGSFGFETTTGFQFNGGRNGTNNTARIDPENGVYIFPNLPTSDPVVAGQLWNDSGTLKVSAG